MTGSRNSDEVRGQSVRMWRY